jgi:hypothetical protein
MSCRSGSGDRRERRAVLRPTRTRTSGSAKYIMKSAVKVSAAAAIPRFPMVSARRPSLTYMGMSVKLEHRELNSVLRTQHRHSSHNMDKKPGQNVQAYRLVSRFAHSLACSSIIPAVACRLRPAPAASGCGPTGSPHQQQRRAYARNPRKRGSRIAGTGRSLPCARRRSHLRNKGQKGQKPTVTSTAQKKIK